MQDVIFRLNGSKTQHHSESGRIVLPRKKGCVYRRDDAPALQAIRLFRKNAPLDAISRGIERLSQSRRTAGFRGLLFCLERVHVLNHGFCIAQKITEAPLLPHQFFDDPIPGLFRQPEVIVLCIADRRGCAENNTVQKLVSGPVRQNVSNLLEIDGVEHAVRESWEFTAPLRPGAGKMFLNSFEETCALSDAVVCYRILAVDGNHVRRFWKPSKRCRAGCDDPVRWHDRRDAFQKAGIDVGFATDESRVNKSLTPHSMEERGDGVVVQFLNTCLRSPVATASDRATVGHVEGKTPRVPFVGLQRYRGNNREQTGVSSGAFRMSRHCRIRPEGFVDVIRCHW